MRTLAFISTLIVLVGCEVPRQTIGPAPWTTQTFIAPDGSEFPYTAWMPGKKPRAVVIALHGLGGAASDWRPLGEHLRQRGVAVYAHELRGMGNDPLPARVGHLDRRRGWLDDFASFALRVQASHPDTPIFWYGESLGGIIATRLLHQQNTVPGLRLSGFILASPIVRVGGKLPPWKECLLRAGAQLLPWARIDLQSLARDDQPPAQVVSTTTHEQQIAKTPHAISRFSLRLLNEIRRFVAENQNRLETGSLPLLVLYAGHDVFTPPEEVEAFFKRIKGTRKERRFYPEGYHLLLHDTGSGAVLAEIEAWMERILDEMSSHRRATARK